MNESNGMELIKRVMSGSNVNIYMKINEFNTMDVLPVLLVVPYEFLY